MTSILFMSKNRAHLAIMANFPCKNKIESHVESELTEVQRYPFSAQYTNDLKMESYHYLDHPVATINFIDKDLNCFLAATSNHQQHPPLHRLLPQALPNTMVASSNAHTEVTSADFRKQRAVMKKDLQRKFGSKDTHDRTR